MAASTGSTPLDPSGDISVVIVAYRSPEVLADCLGSFERHRPARVGEVIVVDNSVDPSHRPDRAFPWIRYVPNAQNVHFRRGVNQGARLARLPYLLLLNPDAYLTDGAAPGALAEVLDRDPTVGYVGPMIRGDDGGLAPQGERLAGLGALLAAKTYVDTIWPRNPLRRRRLREGASRELSGTVDTLTASVLLLRREEFEAVGSFDERATAYWEEHELARKYRRRGQSAYYLADAFVYHRWRRGGTESVPAEESTRLFEEAMRVYYGVAYGRAGLLAYDALDGLRRVLRRAAARVR